MKYVVLFFALFLHVKSWCFIPPLPEVLKKAFSGRRWIPSETHFKHRVKVDGTTEVLIDERLAEIDGKTYHLFSWSSGSAGATSASTGYTFNGQRKIFGSSKVFNAYFTAINPDKFRDIIVSEGFSKRSQWEQYSSSFIPEGNPALWDISVNYLVHPDVYFSRSQTGINILVEGFDNDSSSKSVAFDKESFLLSEISWKKNTKSDYWWFQGSKKISRMGTFPTEMGFVTGENQLVSSKLLQRRYLNNRDKKKWIQKFKADSQSGDFLDVQEALKILLSHR